MEDEGVSRGVVWGFFPEKECALSGNQMLALSRQGNAQRAFLPVVNERKVKPVKPWTQRQECCMQDCKGRAGLQIDVNVLTVIFTEVLVASIKDFLWMWGNNFVFCFVFSPQQNIPSTDDPTRKNNTVIIQNIAAFCSLVWTCVSHGFRWNHSVIWPYVIHTNTVKYFRRGGGKIWSVSWVI